MSNVVAPARTVDDQSGLAVEQAHRVAESKAAPKPSVEPQEFKHPLSRILLALYASKDGGNK